MIKTLLLTRPAEQNEPFASLLETIGFRVLTEPMLRIIPLPEAEPQQERALLSAPGAAVITSRNALRIAHEMRPFQSVPLFVVGEATAAYAAMLGYVCRGVSDTAEALPLLLEKHFSAPDKAYVFYPRGEDISTGMEGALAHAGFRVASVVTYRAEPVTRFSKQSQDALVTGAIAGAAFFSRRTAKAYVRLAEEQGLTEPHQRMDAICISAAVAEAVAPLPWRAVRIAQKPDMQQMLKAASALI